MILVPFLKYYYNNTQNFLCEQYNTIRDCPVRPVNILSVQTCHGCVFTFVGFDCLSLDAAPAAVAAAAVVVDPESTYMFGMLLPKYTLLFVANASYRFSSKYSGVKISCER